MAPRRRRHSDSPWGGTPPRTDIREWAVLALRNVCEDHPPAQAIVAALTAQRPAPTPGLAVDLDDRGRPRMRGPG
jgi:hypothetical protein